MVFHMPAPLGPTYHPISSLSFTAIFSGITRNAPLTLILPLQHVFSPEEPVFGIAELW